MKTLSSHKIIWSSKIDLLLHFSESGVEPTMTNVTWERWLLRKTIEDIDHFNLERAKRKDRAEAKKKLEEEKKERLRKSEKQREEWLKKKELEREEKIREKEEKLRGERSKVRDGLSFLFLYLKV